MQHLLLQQIFVAGHNLLHNANGSAFRKSGVLLDEGIQSAMRAVLEDEVVEVGLFDDLVALDHIGVVELAVYQHLLL